MVVVRVERSKLIKNVCFLKIILKQISVNLGKIPQRKWALG